MNEILSWLGWGAGTLLLVAMAVAGCEHLVRSAQLRRKTGTVGQGAISPAGTRPQRTPLTTVDVPLDTVSAVLLAETPAPATAPTQMAEQAVRREAMAQALSRAAHPGRSQHDGGRWMDTTPRVVGLNEPVLRDRDARSQETTQALNSQTARTVQTPYTPYTPHTAQNAPIAPVAQSLGK